MRKLGLMGSLVIGSLITGCGEVEDALEEGPDVSGSWMTECTQDTDDSGDVEYAIEKAVFTDADATLSIEHYGDTAGCTVAAKQWTLSINGAYAKSKGKGKNGQPLLDLTISGVALIPGSSAIVSFLNSQSVCGKYDWAVDTAFDISSATDTSVCPWAEVNSHYEKGKATKMEYTVEGTTLTVYGEDDAGAVEKTNYTKQ